ncbi:hypothetical protein EMPS_05065 [Entomortierella parvispora]|uniref:Yeast cell wall synthesis Kre9/Knh1-like N-terminal domain-containing protein n=1 Tax=Entomortierella parvispora TaxID=205924 RepID=A0A9P3HAG1_9FUNG|nr:hypothetical protein EMPS_05065 [Entomortierella parvispora]
MIFTKSTIATTLLTVGALMISFAQADSDMLLISNPTLGTTWKVGDEVFLQWKGNCASMGPAAKSVDVNLMTGPDTALRFVAKLASIDCSGTNTRKSFVIPASDIPQSGKYSLQVLTSPRTSYSNIFTMETATGSGSETPVAGNGELNTNLNQGTGQTGTTAYASAAAVLTPMKNNLGSTAATSGVALAAVLIAAQLL